MKFALRYCNTGRYVDAKEAVALAQAAEAAGFEVAVDGGAHHRAGGLCLGLPL